jgi:hypothetical protein
LSKLAEWVDQNKAKVNIEKTFSLDEAEKALNYLRDIHPRGKIVLVIKEHIRVLLKLVYSASNCVAGYSKQRII